MSLFPPSDRPTYEPSKRLVKFRNGSQAYLFSAEEPERLRGPQCLDSSTLVLMADGTEKPICDVRTGDSVATRRGPKNVMRAWMSSPEASVFRLSVSGGRNIIATGDHPVCVTPVALSIGTEGLGTKAGEQLLSNQNTASSSHMGISKRGNPSRMPIHHRNGDIHDNRLEPPKFSPILSIPDCTAREAQSIHRKRPLLQQERARRGTEHTGLQKRPLHCVVCGGEYREVL